MIDLLHGRERLIAVVHQADQAPASIRDVPHKARQA
jgi:hypothetical protein